MDHCLLSLSALKVDSHDKLQNHPVCPTAHGRLCCMPAGFAVLVDAFKEVIGDCKPYSITGSLPCIRDLQEAGFDVQTLGFGKLAAYHANNEYGYLSDFKKGYRVLATLMDKYDAAMSA